MAWLSTWSTVSPLTSIRTMDSVGEQGQKCDAEKPKSQFAPLLPCAQQLRPEERCKTPLSLYPQNLFFMFPFKLHNFSVNLQDFRLQNRNSPVDLPACPPVPRRGPQLVPSVETQLVDLCSPPQHLARQLHHPAAFRAVLAELVDVVDDPESADGWGHIRWCELVERGRGVGQAGLHQLDPGPISAWPSRLVIEAHNGWVGTLTLGLGWKPKVAERV